MGFYTAATYAGLSLGPFGGGFLTDAFGWRSVFVCMAVVCVAALIVSAIFVKERPRSARAPLTDGPGMAAYAAALLALLAGLSESGGSRWALAAAAAGAAGCVGFLRWEMRAARPFMDVKLFMGNRNFLLSNLAAMFNYAATFAVSYLMSIYLQEIKGMTAWNAGLLMIAQPIVQTILAPVSGRMADRHSPFLLASAGMAVCTAALLCFATFKEETPMAFMLATLVLTGCGFGFFSSPNQTAILSCVSSADYSVASSVIATSRSVGQVLCMALITLITALRLGGATLAGAAHAEILGAFRVEFLVFAAICAVGVFISLQRKS
jgi:predicted MFS family arabinose efflux permease